MPEPKAFIDTNVLLYLLSADTTKADRAEAVIRTDSLISVQVLNELTSVARRKLNLSWDQLDQIIDLIWSLCPVEPLTVDLHDRGRRVIERYQLILFFDAIIAASALHAQCDVLYSKHMHNGLLIEEQVRILNPFS